MNWSRFRFAFFDPLAKEPRQFAPILATKMWTTIATTRCRTLKFHALGSDRDGSTSRQKP